MEFGELFFVGNGIRRALLIAILLGRCRDVGWLCAAVRLLRFFLGFGQVAQWTGAACYLFGLVPSSLVCCWSAKPIS